MNRWYLAPLMALGLTLCGCPTPTDSGGGGGTTPDGGGAPSGETLRIAVAGPLTGDSADIGASIKKAAQLWEKQTNAEGGIGGKKVELSIEDDKGLPNEATNVATKIASDEGIALVVGHFNSSCTKAARATYERTGIVEFTPGSTNVTICKESPWTFRNLYHDGTQGIFMARYAQKALGAKSVSLVYEKDEYGTGLKESVAAECAEIGLTIAGEAGYQRGRLGDPKQLATTVQGQKPDVIIICGLYSGAALLTKAIRNDLNWTDVKIFGSDGVMNGALVDTAGETAEGIMVVTPFFFSDSASDEAKAFREAFRKEYGSDPDTWAALTYDALGMAAKGIAEVGADRKALRDWLAGCTSKDKGYTGVTGVTYFDENGDCPGKPPMVVVVNNGEFQAADPPSVPVD
ncbi:MAG: ABC transporter substrate-binding protein [Planctomycetota bacterium]